MGEQTQLDLGIVTREEELSFRRHKARTNPTPLFCARWNVLQVWIVRRQPAGCSNRLMKAGVNPACDLGDCIRQCIHISALELCQFTVLKDQFGQWVSSRKSLQCPLVKVVGISRAETELVKQDNLVFRELMVGLPFPVDRIFQSLNALCGPPVPQLLVSTEIPANSVSEEPPRRATLPL